MHCIERRTWLRRWLAAGLLLTTACAPLRQASEPASPTIVPVPTPSPAAPTPVRPAPGDAASAQAPRELPAPVAARTWDDFRKQAALRLVAGSPSGSYIDEVVEPLLAIPVLEVELNGDGSVRHITVLRHPTQALDTTQLAIDAVRRAAPYGDMRHLKKPWKFVEVFLFNDDRRFKPRTLDAE